MASPRIYVDFDDVLCETTRSFVGIVERHFGRRVPFEALHSFDLCESFGLRRDEYAELMRLVHTPEVLSAFEPRAGARQVLEAWTAAGYEIAVMTGRPPSSSLVSRTWLATHGVPHATLSFVDKYGRPDPNPESLRAGSVPVVALDGLAQQAFALAVEDSPEMATFLAGELGVPVALLDRPWNRGRADDVPRIVRCRSWSEVAAAFPHP